MRKLIWAALLGGSLLAAGIAYGAAASERSSGTSLIRCGKRVDIGLMAPLTGPAASLGQQQLSWSRFLVARWNRSHRLKVRLVPGDTQLPNTAVATQVAERFAADGRILGVVGPAGSQETVVSTAALRARGLAFVSGSAARTTLTREAVRRGFFFRVVPPESLQSRAVATYMTNRLRVRNVFIVDDGETYSVGLSNDVQAILQSRGVTVTRDSVSQSTTNFSSTIAKIDSTVQIVYIPWQLSNRAQLFGQQMREQGKQATLFGSDGLFDPANFTIEGSFVSFFPVAPRSTALTEYRRTHGGNSDYFGAPTYAATQAVVSAIERACRNRSVTRAEVRAQIRRTNIPARQSVLGLRIRFDANGDLRGSRFGIFRIGANGAYTPVA